VFVFDHKILDIPELVGDVPHDLQEELVEFLEIPIFKELARHPDVNDPIFSYLHNETVAEPGIEICRGYGEFDLR
jgi:hypothetical protein